MLSLQKALTRVTLRPAATATFSTKVSTFVSSPDCPKPIGPYTLGKKISTPNGTWGYSAGSIGLCPQSGELVSEDPAEQSDRALKNLQAVAEANGFALTDTIKTTVFIAEMADFAAINEVYAKYFKDMDPDFAARSCVAAYQLPKNAKFEIEAIFFKP